MQSSPLELVIVIDSIGDYGVGKDDASAKENYETDIQPLADADGWRIMRLTVTLPLPEPMEATVTASSTEETVSVMVK